MTELLKGKTVSDALILEAKELTLDLKERGIEPTLAIIRAGRNESDLSYERTLLNKAEKIGIRVMVYEVNDHSNDDLKKLIIDLDSNKDIHGILMFRPLPKGLNELEACKLIAPEKDIDCINPDSAGLVFTSKPIFYPCTAEAVVTMLDFYGVDLLNKDVTILGRSMVVGKPLAMMLMNRNATVTICHSRTKDLKKHTKAADIIVSCMGQKEMIDKSYVGADQIIVDVGVNYDEEKGTITGDCAFTELIDNVKAITPVPGGVGTVTSTILLKHVVDAAKNLC